MKNFLLLLIFAVANLIPRVAVAARQVTIDDTLKYKNITHVEIAPDGKRVAMVVSEPDFDENTIRTNIYVADGNGGFFKLTNATKHDDTPRWSPDGKWLAFISDRDNKPEKAAKKQVWIISPNGGEAWQLTRSKISINRFEWAPDGHSVALIATENPTDEQEKKTKDKDDAVVMEREVKLARIYRASVPDGKTELLYAAERHITALSFSPKGDEIVFADQPSPKVPDSFNSVVRAVNVAGKQVRNLSPADLGCSAPAWSPDGKNIAFECGSRSDWTDNHDLYVEPAAGGAAQKISAAFDERLSEFQWADDSSSIYFLAPHGVNQGIKNINLTGKISDVYEVAGMVRDLSLKSGQIAFAQENMNTPVNLYLASVSRSGLAAKKITDLNPQVAELDLGKTEMVSWKNKSDGLPVEGLVTYPPNYKPGQSYPLLLVIHGGPAGQFGSTFALRRGAYPIQVFASQGYVVLMPNPRGSTGYGTKFRHANLKDWGGGDYHDIQDGVDELIARGVADKERMGVMGWSYGGYMTSWTITQTSRYKAASVGAGVTDLLSMYGTTDIPAFQESYFGGPPWQARELYASRSAMTFVDKITTPTLIQHGQDDKRVPLNQGEQLYTALRARDRSVEMIQYPRSQHGFTEPKLIRDSMVRNVEWFDRYVLGNAQAAKWHIPPKKEAAPAPSGGGGAQK